MANDMPKAGHTEVDVDKSELRRRMLRQFSRDELKVLCADISARLKRDGSRVEVSLDIVGGDGLEAIVIGLIDYLENRGKLGYLVDAVHEARPEEAASGASGLRRPSARKTRLQDLRHILLTRVSEDWQESDVGKPLRGGAPIELTMQVRADLIDNPLELDRRPTERHIEILPPGTEIANVFEEKAKRALLIVSARKAGKRTTLFDLRDALVELAKEKGEPMPVVVPLGTWPDDQPDEGEYIVDGFYEWLISRLTGMYVTTGIDEDAFKEWVDNRELILLLYGVEQIDPEYREACIQAINGFLRKQHVAGIVVCSNTFVYERLKTRLTFYGAVELQPLTPQQIDSYLAGAGDQLAGLRALIQRDEEKVQELEMSPFDLGTMIDAYLGAPNKAECEFIQLCEAVEARRKANYDGDDLERTFEKSGVGDHDERQQIKDWLSWLANQMRAHHRNPFYLEDMQPNWLPTPGQRRLHMILAALAVCLSAGGTAWWALYRITIGVFFPRDAVLLYGRPDPVPFYGPIVGPLFGVAAALATWLAARRISGYRGAVGVGLVCWLAAGLGMWWPARRQDLGLLGGFIVAFVIGLIFFLLVKWLAGDLGSTGHQIEIVEIKRWRWSKALLGLVLGALAGIVTWLVIDLGRAIYQETDLYEVLTCRSGLWQLYGCPAMFGFGLLCFLLFGLRSGTVKLDEEASPNQGIRRSAKHALYVAGGSAMAVGLPFVLAHYLYDGGWSSDPLFGVALGVTIGLIGGLIFGGLVWLQHWILRLILYSKGHIPLNYVGFLDRAADLEFLEKRGRGYEFRTPWQDFFGKQ